MQFLSRMTYYPKPYEPNNVIVSHEVDILCRTEFDEPVVGGRVAIDYLDFDRANALGHPILSVCDADSASWEKVYSSVIEPNPDFEEIREDFGFDDPIIGLVFLRQSVFHPALRDWQCLIIDEICGMFSPFTATVMDRHETDMDDKERASLGFRMIAESDLLFRPNMLRNAYCADDDERDIFDLILPEDAQDYVDERWDWDGDGA